MKAEGPLRNLLEVGREVVCAEGLLRRDIQGSSEALHPVQQGAAASKNGLTGGTVSPGMGGGNVPLLL